MWTEVKILFRRITQVEVNLNKLVFNDLKKTELEHFLSHKKEINKISLVNKIPSESCS